MRINYDTRMNFMIYGVVFNTQVLKLINNNNDIQGFIQDFLLGGEK